MFLIETGIDNGVDVTVDAAGFIHFDGRVLNPRQAANVATALLTGIQISANRDQINRPDYYDSKNILRRAESPVGKAIDAARRVF